MISYNGFKFVHLSSICFSKLITNANINLLKFNPFVIRTISSGKEPHSFIREPLDPFIEKSSKFLTPVVDLIHENFQKCKTSEDIFNVICNNLSIMQNQHLCFAFKLLENQPNVEYIRNLPLFKSLCNKTLRSIRYFRTNELLIVLGCLNNFGIPPNTGLMRGILQMLRNQINELTVDEIITLEYLMNLMMKKNSDDINKKVPLMHALNNALPILLQIKIDAKEYDFRNISTIIKCFRILAKGNPSIDLLNDLLLRIEQKIENLNYRNSILLIMSFCDIEKNFEGLSYDIFYNLVKTSFEIITNEFDKQNEKSKDSALKLFVNQQCLDHFYDRGFNIKIISYISENINKIKFVDAYNALLCLAKNDHLSLDYLDIFITLLLKNSDFYLKTNLMSPFLILTAYEMANYKIYRNNWNKFVNLHINKLKLINKNQINAKQLVEFMKILAVLNDYQNVHKLENNLLVAINNLHSKNILEILNESLLLLNAGLQFEHRCNLSVQLIEKLNPLINLTMEIAKYENDDFLFPFIGLALGGKEFYKKDVWTEYGQYIDYLIILKNGQYPISLKEGNKLHFLDIPPNSTKIAIIPLNESDYCNEPPILKGHINFKLRTLETYGLITKTINVKNWEALSDREKIPYLKSKIDLNCDVKNEVYL